MRKLTLTVVAALLAATVNAQGLSLKELPLSLAEVAVKVKSPDAQIIDARTAEEFEQNHLKGAVNINPSAEGYEQELAKLSKEKPVFVYSIANGRSVNLAGELRAKGFREVNVLPGGIANWIGSGYPIYSSSRKGVAISPTQFNTLITSSDLVLFDFGSRYCGACRRLIPVLDSLEKQQGFSAKIVRVEAYDNTDLLKRLKINQLPTLVLYNKGKVVWKKQGQSSTTEISAIISANNKKSELVSSGK